MPSPIALPNPESMTKKTMVIYIIAVIVAALLISFFADLLLGIRSLTFGSRFEIYTAFVLMVLIVAVGLFVHHLFKGLRKAV